MAINQELAAAVEELRGSIAQIQRFSEDEVKQTIVLRLLSALGWNIFSRDEVNPEYSVGGRRVDYALRVGKSNKVFIEVKRPGEDLDKHEEQLLDYSFKQGVRLAVLTNGVTWWFYLPLSEGSWQERKFFAIDVLQQKPTSVCSRFSEFLGRSNVATGRSEERAEQLYKSQQRQARIRETLPKAWNAIVSEPDELLVDLVIDRTEELCGYRAEVQQVQEFIRGLRFESARVRPSPKPPEPKPAKVRHATAKPVSFTFQQKRYEVRQWNEILPRLCAVLARLHRGRFEEVLQLRGRKRPYFSRNPAELIAPKLIDGPGIYVETNWSEESTRLRCQKLIEHFGHSANEFSVEVEQVAGAGR